MPLLFFGIAETGKSTLLPVGVDGSLTVKKSSGKGSRQAVGSSWSHPVGAAFDESVVVAAGEGAIVVPVADDAMLVTTRLTTAESTARARAGALRSLVMFLPCLVAPDWWIDGEATGTPSSRER
jgi:hypothetical protein